MHLLPSHPQPSLVALLDEAPINTLFARVVLNGQVDGQVFADDPHDPKTWCVVHPYGMSLLLGECGNAAFNAWLLRRALNEDRSRSSVEWLQAWPASWDVVLGEIFRGQLTQASTSGDPVDPKKIELNTRVNFRFDPNRFSTRIKAEVGPDLSILRVDGEAFRHMPGAVVPRHFWKSEADFLQKSIGFSVYVGGRLASMCFAACIHERHWEIGIETVLEFRGRGLAQLACEAFIHHCMEHDLEPIWACRKDNVGSYMLAQKLGFVPSRELPYYKLPV